MGRLDNLLTWFLFGQTFLRLSFELNLSRQSAADRETLAALTSHYNEQEEELKRLREDL